MNKITGILIAFITLQSIAFSQSKDLQDSKLKAQIIAKGKSSYNFCITGKLHNIACITKTAMLN
jgi:hypothetical protein